MNLSQVIPWGRSFEEYRLMFSLSDAESARILGVADGPASFNGEATAEGWDIVSADPIYRFAPEEIEKRFHDSADDVEKQVRAHPDLWEWSFHKGPSELRGYRERVLGQFLNDFAERRTTGRYIAASLPKLPFDDDSFDIALCSHFLFLYSSMFDLEFHVASVEEMLRLAREVRIFPLVGLDARESEFVAPVSDHFTRRGCRVHRRRVDYAVQKGADQHLVISREG